jgi:hypothetical protein
MSLLLVEKKILVERFLKSCSAPYFDVDAKLLKILGTK